MTATQQQRVVSAEPRRRGAAPAVPARPKLHVVDGRELDARRVRRRRQAMTVVTLVIVAAGLFGLVASHVVLTQGQFKLQRIQRQADEEQARYERMRLQVAQLESPSRIVAVAQERLGMVPPAHVKYLAPTPNATSPAVAPPNTPAQQTASATTDWSTVKKHLATKP